MKEFGGFEHNLQSLRVVDVLEERYASFEGLNLSFESREGILKHCSLNNARTLGDLGKRFIDKTQPSLEAQLTNLADEIAYNNHDIDDGLRSGLLNESQLMEVDCYARFRHEVDQTYPGIMGRRAISETIRRMINMLITDLIQASEQRIADCAPKTIDDVRTMPAMIAFSEVMYQEAKILKQFLHENLYRHYLVNRMSNKAKNTVRDLFTLMMAEPGLVPPDYRVSTQSDSQQTQIMQARKIADYIAGMTDRFAIREHRRLYLIEEV
jgi:dGTPase